MTKKTEIIEVPAIDVDDINLEDLDEEQIEELLGDFEDGEMTEKGMMAKLRESLSTFAGEKVTKAAIPFKDAYQDWEDRKKMADELGFVRDFHVTGSGLQKAQAAMVKMFGSEGFRVVFEPAEKCTPRVNLDAKVVYFPVFPQNPDAHLVKLRRGFTDHETAHIRYTDPNTKKLDGSRGFLMNAIEDGRIEELMGAAYLGSQMNLEYLNDYYTDTLLEQSEKGQPGQLELVTFLLALHRLSSGQSFDVAVKGHAKMKESVLTEILQDFEEPLNFLKDTADVKVVTENLFEAIKHLLPPPPPPSSGEGWSGEGDPEQSEEEGAGGGQGLYNDDEAEPQPKEGEGEGEGGEADDSEGDDGTDEGSGKGEGDDESDGSGAGSGDGEGEGDGSESGSSDDSSKGSSSESGSSGDGTDDADGSGDPGKAEGGGLGSGQIGGKSSKKHHELDPEEMAAIDQLLNNDIDPKLQDFGKWVGSEIAKTLKGMHMAGSGSFYSPYTDSDKLITPSVTQDSRAYDSLTSALNSSRSQIGILVNKLLMIMKTSKPTFERFQDRGQLDDRRIGRFVLGETRIFRRRQPQDQINTAFTLLIDMSGSMAGTKIKLAAQTAMIFSSVLEALNVKHEILGFTTADWNSPHIAGYNRTIPLKHVIVKAREEKLGAIKGRFGYVVDGHMNHNVDCEAVEWAAQRLATAREERKVLMVLSDGWPEDGYDNDLQRKRLKEVVAEVERIGIHCIGVGVTSPAVKAFYKDYVVFNSLDDLLGGFLKKLSDVLLRTRNAAR